VLWYLLEHRHEPRECGAVGWVRDLVEGRRRERGRSAPAASPLRRRERTTVTRVSEIEIP